VLLGGEGAFPALRLDKQPFRHRLYTGRVSIAYWLGVAAGLGAALGVLAAGALAAAPRGRLLAVFIAAAVAAAAGYALGDWGHAVLAGVAAAVAALAAGTIADGTLRRGGTPVGTGMLLAGLAVVFAALAFVPLLGYVEALVPAALAARLQRRAGERYAGLRVLARD
jgi:hypothetical protein